MSTEKIFEKSIGIELENKYIDYAMSVIIGRAIPDVRDGLKPVHRRIIYSMYVNRFFYNQPFVKCARIVGDVLGKYHPHGDQAVYNSLVRMAQDFSLRYPLIEPQGNFGSIDGDEPAAYRYTEARLFEISNELIEDINKNTVDIQPNFDESLQEPRYFPSKLPTLLVNGTSGIAVGMSTNMAPHNLIEVCDAIIAKIDKPDISIGELMTKVLGPDFPTGGIIINPRGVTQAFKTGRGRIIVRGNTNVEIEKGGKMSVVITEIPYMVNKTSLIHSIAKLVREKELEDVRDLRDESDQKGMRIVIELTKNGVPDLVKNILFKRTKLQDSFNIINLTLIPKIKDDQEYLQPKILNLSELISEYLKHRERIVYKRTVYDRDRAKEKLHKIEGLLIALDDIDNVIQIIKSSKDASEASTKLMTNYKLTKIQTDAILSMRLSKLTSLETQKLVDDKKDLTAKIGEFEKIISSEHLRYEIIKKELKELSQKYGDERKTQIFDLSHEKDLQKQDLIKVKSMIVTLTEEQYIKRIPADLWSRQLRGGKGKKILKEDILREIFSCSTHDDILFFTSKGRVYSKRCFDIPKQSRTSKGRSIVNFLRLKEDEKIAYMYPLSSFAEEASLIFITKNGLTKKTPLKYFTNIQKSGKIAIKIRENDELLTVLKLEKGPKDLFIGTKNGYAARFDISALKNLGRTAMGVKGITLRENDEVIDALLADQDTIILTLTKQGVGKRTPLSEYRKTKRSAMGVININFKSENDEVIAIRSPSVDHDLLIGTKQGQVIRIDCDTIRETHRVTQGVKAIDLYENDEVVSVGRCTELVVKKKNKNNSK